MLSLGDLGYIKAEKVNNLERKLQERKITAS